VTLRRVNESDHADDESSRPLSKTGTSRSEIICCAYVPFLGHETAPIMATSNKTEAISTQSDTIEHACATVRKWAANLLAAAVRTGNPGRAFFARGTPEHAGRLAWPTPTRPRRPTHFLPRELNLLQGDIQIDKQIRD